MMKISMTNHLNFLGLMSRYLRRLSRSSWLFIYIVLLTLLVFLSNTVFAAETLILCLEKSDVRPWRTQDGGGLNIDLLNQVAKKLGVNFEYQGMPWKHCLAQLKANEVSGAIGASFKVERLEMGAYPGGTKPDASKRLNFDRYVLLRRKGSAVKWDGKSFHNLDGAIGIQLGYSIGEMLRNAGATVDEGAQRAQELAFKLIAGRLGAAAMLDGEANILLQNEPKIAGQLEILPTPLIEKPYFLILSHALVSSRPELAAKIWGAIEETRNSSSYQKLERDVIEGAIR